MHRIAIDAMGGDEAPRVVVEGAVQAAKSAAVQLILVGDRDRVTAELERLRHRGKAITVRHAGQVIGMRESPGTAVRRKRDSSIRICFDMVKEGQCRAVVSAGNSGAVMAAGIFILGRLPGVERPAIAATFPTLSGEVVCLDMGANVECRPTNLLQFAVMGEVYARLIQGKSSPRIGVLANGTEDGKGTELTRETISRLRELSFNCLGHIEGRDIFNGTVDVVLCDGFTGNVVLKSAEGMAEAIFQMLRKGFAGNLLAQLGYLLARGALRKLARRVDYAEYGGAPLLGVNGVSIIAHGGSSTKAISNAIIVAHRFINAEINREIEKGLGRLTGKEDPVTKEEQEEKCCARG